MVNPYICGFINPASPTFVRKAFSWNELIYAYNGYAADFYNLSDQGCKGKQLPGDTNTFYFVAMEYNVRGAPQVPYIVKAFYNPTTDTIALVYKALPSIFGIVAIPKPNQLTVTTDGRVFMPVGSYDSPYGGTRLYYFDITGTLSNDPNDWTITARYTSLTQVVDEIDGTFCMCLSEDETQIMFMARAIVKIQPNVFLQLPHLCDLDGSNPVTFLTYVDAVQTSMPRNIECIKSGTAMGKYVLCSLGMLSGEWELLLLEADNSSWTNSTLRNNTGRSVASGDNEKVYVINNRNICNISPNPVDIYTLAGAAYIYSTTIAMVCPQATPTHHDIYLPTKEPWTASGQEGTETSGSVRQGAPVAQDWEATPNYLYVCTAAPRRAV